MIRTQYAKIINALYENGSLTAVKARKMGITNLRARVCEMRNVGHLIMSNPIKKNGRIISEYRFFKRQDYFR